MLLIGICEITASCSKNSSSKQATSSGLSDSDGTNGASTYFFNIFSESISLNHG